MAKIKPSAESTTAPLLKDHINPISITRLGQLIKQYQPVFAVGEFIEQSVDQLENMALKDRVNHLSSVLSGLLAEDYADNAKWLKKLAENWPDREINNGWHSFMTWPLIDYVGKQGVQQPEIALDLLKHLTPLFTAEFAIRPYIETHFELTYRYLLKWCDDENEHVRRLASEGIRPRLPWGGHLKALQQNPKPIFELLDLLKDDNSRYVQKSVANNLNDISKDNPQQVIQVCRTWQKEATPQRNWIIRHGLRSLIKAGEPAVFPLLGYSECPAVDVDFTLLQQQVELGGVVQLQATIHSLTEQIQRLVVDYRVWHIKANGKSTAKVYKWKNVQLLAGQSIDLNKSHGFVKLSTRQYYSGNHLIELLINGEVYGQASVDLVLD